MHVGAVAIFESGSFRLPSGAVDIEKFRRYIESRFPAIPRCRQKLRLIPVTRHPVWVDNHDFRIEDHIQEVVLPAPGGEAELKRMASDLFSRPLDRSKGMWEMWVVQGYADPERFAIISKAHHGMIDGIAGMDFLAAMLTLDAVDDIPATPPFSPVPAPSAARLLLDETVRYASAPYHLARGLRALATNAGTRRAFSERAFALTRFFMRGIWGTSRSPLTAAPTASRSLDWFATERTDERSLRARIGGTRDDVALATATGAVRDLMLRTGTRIPGLRLRAMAPNSLRTRDERGTLGNHVSMLIVDLPVAEPDARRRLERIIETTAKLKAKKHHLGVDILAQIDRWLPAVLAQRASMWLATRVRAYNIVVTNIPGPPVPLYALDAKLIDLFPLAPVFAGQHINVAAATYCSKLYWGVHYAGADPAELPQFTAALERSFHELVVEAAAAHPRMRVMTPAEMSLGAVEHPQAVGGDS